MKLKKKYTEKRVVKRKNIEGVYIEDLTTIDNYNILARSGSIMNSSPLGFLLRISRNDIVPKYLRQNISLDLLIGEMVVLYLPQMNLDLDGKILRASYSGDNHYEIAIEFSSDVPMYWRQCLVDLLPMPGEMT